MRASIKFAREIAKKCFRINEVVNGKEYIAVFDTKLCAQLVEEKFTSTIVETESNDSQPLDEATTEWKLSTFRSHGFINKTDNMGRIYIDLPINEAKIKLRNLLAK